MAEPASTSGTAATSSASDLTWQWIATRDLSDAPRDLAAFSAVWLIPASPYENMASVLSAVRFAPHSPLHAAYVRATAHEGYHCNYGLNPAHCATLEPSCLRFTAFDDQDEVRAAELPVATHPFFVGTFFQPERAALCGDLPPLVAVFVGATSPPDRAPPAATAPSNLSQRRAARRVDALAHRNHPRARRGIFRR